MKKVIIIGICTLMLLVLVFAYKFSKMTGKGIGMDNTEEITVVLNERQKKILEQEGLPTVYEELDFAQKSAIESIELLLQQLEKKYGDHFAYIKYKPTGMSGPASLVAKDLDRKELGAITITGRAKKGKMTYEDDFEEREAEVLYKKELFEFLDKQIPGDDSSCFIYCNIYTYDKKTKDIIKGSKAVNCVALSGVSEKQLKKMVYTYNDWMLEKETKYGIDTLFFTIEKKKFSQINENNIWDYATSDNYEKCWEWTKDSEGIRLKEKKD